MKGIISLLVYLIIMFCSTSCWQGADKISAEIVGTYEFTFPSGIYERLEINKDSSIVQKYYSNLNSFKNNEVPIFSSNGKWFKSKDNQIGFDNFLEYCRMSDPNDLLSKPEHISRLNVYWNKQSSRNESTLSLYYENGYVFEKVDQ